MAGKRTAREIAQEKLDVAERKLDANKRGQAEMAQRLEDAKAREGELAKLVAYLRAHPALQDEEEDEPPIPVLGADEEASDVSAM